MVTGTRGVARRVAAGLRRADRGVLRRQNAAVLEVVRIIRRVALQAGKRLREVDQQVVTSRTEVDREVLGVPRKADLPVAANLSRLVRTAERVAVVQLVVVKKTTNVEVVHPAEIKSWTEKVTKGPNLLHTRTAVAIHVALLSRKLIEVVQPAVTGTIRINRILQHWMKTTKRQEVVADQEVMTKTRTEALLMKRKVVQHMNARVAVGQLVRIKVVVILSLEAQRKIEVEVVQAVVTSIDPEVVQKIAARQEASHQAQLETERKVLASHPSVTTSQKVVLQPQRRSSRVGAVQQVVARVMIKLTHKALKGRSSEAVRVKILRAVTKLRKATLTVHLVRVAGHHLLVNRMGNVVEKATRNHVATLPVKTDICT